MVREELIKMCLPTLVVPSARGGTCAPLEVVVHGEVMRDMPD